ncbi:hypothetical protein Tco_0832687 [Tanacetum coccineum]
MGDVELIKEDKIKPIPTMPNPILIISSSPTMTPFLKDCTPHILKEKMFEHDVSLKHVGDEKLKSIGGIGNEVLKGKKDVNGVPKEPNKEWKLNKKMVPLSNGGGCLEAKSIDLIGLC